MPENESPPEQPKKLLRFNTMKEFMDEIGNLDPNKDRAKIEELGFGPNIGDVEVIIGEEIHSVSTDEKDFGTPNMKPKILQSKIQK